MYPPYNQTPVDPVTAAQQAQEELARIVQAQREEQRKQAAAQQQAAQQQGGVSGIVGQGIMDELVGSGGGIGEAGVSQAGIVGEAGVSGAGAAGEVAAPATMPGVGGIVAGGYTGYQQAKGAQALTERKDPSLIQHAALFPVTGGFSLLSKAPGFGHKTTKEREKERWGGLIKNSNPENKGYQETIANLGEAAHGASADDKKWEQIKDEAMKSAPDMWGQFGMLDTFKEDYFQKMSEFQRYAATQYAIDNNLLKGDHGDIIVTDPDKLRGALEEFSNNEDYKRQYEAWKKGGEKQIGTEVMDTVTGGPQSANSGGGSGVDFDSILSGTLKGIRDQAAGEEKRQRGISLMQKAAQPIDSPSVIKSGVLKTGVESLDDILGSVLS